MKIMFLAAACSTHTARWVNELTKREHEIHLVYLSEHRPSLDQLNKKIKLYELPEEARRGILKNAKEVRRLYQKIKPDLINAHYASDYGLLAAISRVKPVVLSVWGSDVYTYPYSRKLHMITTKLALRKAAMIGSTSNCMAEQVRRLVNGKPIGVTPFGIDLNQFNPEYFHKEEKEKWVIGVVKTLRPAYGIDYLIEAADKIKKLLKENGIKKELEVHIYGDGEQKTQLEQLVKERQLGDCVHFLGKIPNSKVPEALRQFDVFCATSTVNESFGVSVVEAMAMHVPVVAFDVPGFREVLKNGECGILVPVKDTDKLAQAVFELLNNPGLREQYQLKAADRVKKEYDWQKNVSSMEELYCQAVKIKQ